LLSGQSALTKRTLTWRNYTRGCGFR